MNIDIVKLKKFEDRRGYLIEFLKNIELKEKEFGQIYLTTIEPDCMRGNHYHETKDEYLAVISGKAEIILEDVITKERSNFIVNGSDRYISRIKIDKNIAHLVKNVGKNTLILAAYATEEYKRENLDQIEYILLKQE